MSKRRSQMIIINSEDPNLAERLRETLEASEERAGRKEIVEVEPVEEEREVRRHPRRSVPREPLPRVRSHRRTRSSSSSYSSSDEAPARNLPGRKGISRMAEPVPERGPFWGGYEKEGKREKALQKERNIFLPKEEREEAREEARSAPEGKKWVLVDEEPKAERKEYVLVEPKEKEEKYEEEYELEMKEIPQKSSRIPQREGEAMGQAMQGEDAGEKKPAYKVVMREEKPVPPKEHFKVVVKEEKPHKQQIISVQSPTKHKKKHKKRQEDKDTTTEDSEEDKNA